MNPNDEIHRSRLFKALEGSYRALEPFRNLTRSLTEEYAGTGYGRSANPKRPTMINLMNQAADAYTMGLVANRPRVLLTSPRQELSYFRKQFQTALNNLAEEICLELVLRQWVLDALFCVGVVKVHMGNSTPVMVEQGLWMDPGSPAASNVSLDNYCFDMGATRRDQVKFEGDMYRIPFEDLQGDMFDQDAVKDITPTSKYESDTARLDGFSRGSEIDNDELEPMVDLADIWVPRDGLIYTFPIQNRGKFCAHGKPIAVLPWEGPEFGPYHHLGFNDVPENILPTSPFSHLSMLSRLINNIMRKQSRRAQSHKRNHTYTAGAADDAKKLQSSVDDEWIQVNDPKEIGLHDTGGVDPNSQAFMLGCLQLFDRMAGNLTAMMGLGAQASTLGQEQLIHGAVSKKEAQMQYRVFDGTRRLFRDIGYLLWNDKFKVIPGQMPIEGAEGYSVDMPWTPEDREGSFFDYNFAIDVYSMGYQSPTQRLTNLNQLLTQIYLPSLPVIAQQGHLIDWGKIIETHAELLNEPRIKEWIRIAPSPASEEPEGQDMSGPKTSSREYIRRSVPSGGTAASRQHVEMQDWLNGAVNPQQKATLSRAAA